MHKRKSMTRIAGFPVFSKPAGQACARSNTWFKKTGVKIISLCWLLLCAVTSHAHAVQLDDWIFYVDGNIYDSIYGATTPTMGTLDDGIGTLSLEITGAGAHNVIGFFDFEVDQNYNTFYNEYASVNGVPEAGQSWEIDEPGLDRGDIVAHVDYGKLDNMNAVPVSSEDDVSFAIGWNFALLPDDTAVIDYIFTGIWPAADFFLTQVDPNSGSEFYFYSGLTIQSTGGPPGPAPAPVPEPGTTPLMLTALIIAWTQRRRGTLFRKR